MVRGWRVPVLLALLYNPRDCSRDITSSELMANCVGNIGVVEQVHTYLHGVKSEQERNDLHLPTEEAEVVVCEHGRSITWTPDT